MVAAVGTVLGTLAPAIPVVAGGGGESTAG